MLDTMEEEDAAPVVRILHAPPFHIPACTSLHHNSPHCSHLAAELPAGFRMQECACCCWLLLLQHGWPLAAAASVTPSANEGAVTPLHCTLWQVTVAVTVRCQRPHAPTATTIAGRCCCRFLSALSMAPLGATRPACSSHCAMPCAKCQPVLRNGWPLQS
jgi:hypothetical protein